MLRKVLKPFLANNLPAVILIIAGTIIWSLTMVKSGFFYSYGLGFWGPNGHDGVWHLAVIEQLAKGSFRMPVFAGEIFKNYHLGFDALAALLHRLTFIPIQNLYFQVIPPILALLIGLFAYKFTLSWTRSSRKAWWACFFVYFGGSFGFILTLARGGEIGGESLFWSQQAISTLINLPFALSILLMLLGLWLLTKLKEKSPKRYTLFAILAFGILLPIKVYAGILSLGGLLLIGLYQYLKLKRTQLLKIFTGSFLISVILFLPFNKGSTSLLVFQPFWFLETMMGFADRFYWPKFFNAMIAYKQGGNIAKGVLAYTVAFGIFLVGNLGTRVIKELTVWKWIKGFRKLTFVEIFLLAVIGVGIIIPMFFIQKGTPWNTIQFIYYSLTFSGILAGVAMGDYLEKNSNTMIRIIVPSAIILLTIPTTIGTLGHYLPSRPPAKLSYTELGALKFLSKQPEGVVLTYPYDKKEAEAAKDNPPRPLYLYESTAYVSAFSGQPVYLEDEVNLDITGYNWRERREKVLEFFNDATSARKVFLDKNDISYIYLIKGQSSALLESQDGIERIFENKEVDIYKVNHLN